MLGELLPRIVIPDFINHSLETHLLSRSILVLVLLALVVPSVGQSPSSPTSTAPSFDERLGNDDGAVAAILFGANLRGNLQPCDCAHPRGGLARRIGYLEGFRKKFPETPVIQLECGLFLMDSTGYPDLVMFQNNQVAQAYSRWSVDVINLSRYDLIYARKMLDREGLAERVTALPMLKNLISANGIFDASVQAPPPYVIKEITGPRIKGKKKKLRVGFVGLAEPIRAAEGRDATVKDIFAAGRKAVLEARKQCDVLVLVAHAEVGASLKLAEQNPEADVVIAGNAETIIKPRNVGKTLVIYAAPGNMQQGDLRLYLGPEGAVTFKFQSPDLDANVPSDPAATEFTEAARQSLELVRTRR
jgi:hypothetical protein